LYQRVCELDPAAAAGPAAAAAASGISGSGSSTTLDGGVAHKGEALLLMLAELQITPESYSGHLQPLLVDVSVDLHYISTDATYVMLYLAATVGCVCVHAYRPAAETHVRARLCVCATLLSRLVTDA
jgi:hypothetical protein